MLSTPRDSTNEMMTSGVACHHCPWTVHTVGRCRAWHEITALGLHAWSDYIGRGMTSPPLDSTHGRTALGMACHCHPWTANTVEQRRAWNAIISFGKYARSTLSGVACHHGPWTPHTIERSQSWHAIIALERQTRLNDVRHGMKQPPLGSTHGLTTSGVA